MKKITLAIFSLAIFGISNAQVEINEDVFVGNGGVLFISSNLNVNTNGLLKVEGDLILENAITGDDKIQLEPTANVTVESGTLTLSNQANEEFNSLTIGNNGLLEIAAGNTLLLNGDLTNSSLSTGLKMQANSTNHYAQLKVKGNQTGTGQVLSELYIDGNAGWKYGGSPINTSFQDLANPGSTIVAATFPTGNIFYWDANTAEWDFPNSVNDNFEQGKGYNIFMGASGANSFVTTLPGKVDLEGPLFTNTDVSVALGYHNGQGSTVGFENGTTAFYTQGWNMLANPYPCVYDLTGQSLPSGLNDAYYIWNSSGATSGQFTQYANGVGVNNGSQYLAPYQSLFVQTTNSANPGSFVFEADQRVVHVLQEHFKTENFNSRMRMTVWQLENSKNSDENYLEFEENATDDFDNNWDAREMTNGEGTPNFYYNLKNEEFAINRMAIFENSKTVPVNFKCSKNGSYVIDPNLVDMDPFWTIELEDLVTGEMYDLRAGNVTFEHNSKNTASRFLLHINGGDEDYFSHTNNRVKIYGIQNRVVVKLTGQTSYSRAVSVYDLQGRLMATGFIEAGEKEIEIPIRIKDVGIYIVYFESNDMTKSERVFLTKN